MISYDSEQNRLTGPSGSFCIPGGDGAIKKLLMLIEGECVSTPIQAAKKFGYSRQYYFFLRKNFEKLGLPSLINEPRGPKTNYRRSKEVTCQAIRHRFLDPDASSEVIAQKLNQCGFDISKRSVDRIIAEYGLQKKTLRLSAGPAHGNDRGESYEGKHPPRGCLAGRHRTGHPANPGE